MVKHAVRLASLPGLWVPCDLLRYIHKGDRPFSQRLSCFEQAAEGAGEHITISDGHPSWRTVRKRKLGASFLSHLATFIFFVFEEAAEEELVLPHMQVGGLIKESQELSAQPVDLMSEEAQLRTEYPRGLAGVLEETKTHTGLSTILKSEPRDEAIREVEVTTLSNIVIN